MRIADSEILFQISNMKKYKVCRYLIEQYRQEKRDVVLADIQSYQQELTGCINAKINRVKFLNKFYLYSGIAKSTEREKQFDINKNECVDELRCNPRWPVCLFDYTYKNKVPEYFIFRVDPSTYTIIDDYCDRKLDYFSSAQSNSNDMMSGSDNANEEQYIGPLSPST